ncbi:hypothetical protein M413DRAFT_444082 [Hebeloma cylindrosporum]|uniref:ADP-ribose 1''-phosphate phosphatase n=1 Tax=Hebeloma cylindrosporum TaxID=76867 RepID=A0A0C2YQI3_HEBCY|nr:hypothetical protein M413DRAFT_444082 [Hebeloma cylindrosporum h7]
MSKLKLSYITGDLFAAPANSILVHACNTKGSWGAGIALAFKEKYPSHCLLIPGDTHDIACLFTSIAYGRRKDSPSEILSATRTSVQDLIRQNVGQKPLHACRFNSGKFAVPWVDTEAILKELEVSMVIYVPEDA